MDQPPKASEGLAPSLSDAIDKIMAHPELISMVASAIGAPDRPREEPSAATEDPSPPPPTEPTDSLAALSPMLSKLSQAKHTAPRREKDARSDLLCALKPYLSPGRQEAIDYMIRISQISDLLKHLT
ncbi:MAG: hypothetical protein IJY47_04110 [Clostridia bacterium]|nr:hypothetical protein [Clostridia bacterium]